MPVLPRLETPYSSALQQYRKSISYQNTVEVMKKKGMMQPYIDNILVTAFELGWNSKPDVIINENRKN